MVDKLKPCPFCGGEAAVRDIKEPSANGWVGCQRCRCFMDFVKNGKPQAIAAWNRRESDAVRPPEYKVNPNYPHLGKAHYCASCGVMFVDWENAPTNYCGNCGQKLREVSHE